MPNNESFSIGRVLFAVVCVIVLFFVIVLNMPDPRIDYREQYAIYKMIKDENYKQIKLDDIEKWDSKYRFNFIFKGANYDLAFKELLSCFDKLVEFIADNDLSLNYSRIELKIRPQNDSSYEVYELSNYVNSDSFEFDKLRYVLVSDRVQDATILNDYKDEIISLNLNCLQKGRFPEFTEFENLKVLHLYKCTKADGSELLTAEQIEELVQRNVDLKLDDVRY